MGNPYGQYSKLYDVGEATKIIDLKTYLIYNSSGSIKNKIGTIEYESEFNKRSTQLIHYNINPYNFDLLKENPLSLKKYIKIDKAKDIISLADINIPSYR